MWISRSRLITAAATTVAASNVLRRLPCSVVANLTKLSSSRWMSSSNTPVQDRLHKQSIENPQQFWKHAAQDIEWSQKPEKTLEIFDVTDGENAGLKWQKWFSDGQMNTCYNAIDRHVRDGRADQVAIYYDSPVTGTYTQYTFAEVQQKVEEVAAVLQNAGISKGDRVLIYMPMVPEAVFGMLACARLGAVHSVVFGGFAARELAVRIKDAEPKAVLSATGGFEPNRVVNYTPLLKEALEISGHNPALCLMLDRGIENTTSVSDVEADWNTEVEKVKAQGDVNVPCVEVNGDDPLYVLYTSGTTGKPKGVVRDNAGYSVALNWTMSNIFAVQPGDVFFAASDIGWVVGHSYIVYGPLIYGCSTVLFEGKPIGTPDASTLWRVVNDYNVKTIFAAPTAVRAIRKQDPDLSLKDNYPIDQLKNFFVAGERCDPDTFEWLKRHFSPSCGVIDHWWQTETGWPMSGILAGHDPNNTSIAGSAGKAVPGYDIQILDSEDNQVGNGEFGNIAVKLPLPPGTMKTLWQNESGLVKSYLTEIPGYYNTGDAGLIDENGYLHVMSRTDDIINVAGHRLATGGIEQVVASHSDIAECAVVARKDQLKGEIPIGFFVLQDNTTKTGDEVSKELVQMVRNDIGAFVCFAQAFSVKRLPKTRSGKVLRNVIRKMVDDEEYVMPATIEDADALDEIHEIIREGILNK